MCWNRGHTRHQKCRRVDARRHPAILLSPACPRLRCPRLAVEIEFPAPCHSDSAKTAFAIAFLRLHLRQVTKLPAPSSSARLAGPEDRTRPPVLERFLPSGSSAAGGVTIRIQKNRIPDCSGSEDCRQCLLLQFGIQRIQSQADRSSGLLVWKAARHNRGNLDRNGALEHAYFRSVVALGSALRPGIGLQPASAPACATLLLWRAWNLGSALAPGSHTSAPIWWLLSGKRYPYPIGQRWPHRSGPRRPRSAHVRSHLWRPSASVRLTGPDRDEKWPPVAWRGRLHARGFHAPDRRQEAVGDSFGWTFGRRSSPPSRTVRGNNRLRTKGCAICDSHCGSS